MSSPLSKGDTSLTPAQQQAQANAMEQTKRFTNTWLPFQSYFAQQLNNDQAGLQTAARGKAAGQAQGGSEAAASKPQNLGSGNSIAGIAGGGDASANATASGETMADSEAKKHYITGLGTALGLFDSDEKMANNETNTAANEQAQEKGINSQNNQQTDQGIGEIAGLATKFI